MKYPKPTDRYSCQVICENFMEVEERLIELEENGGAEVTTESIVEALGYTPANDDDVKELSEQIANIGGTGSGLPTVTEADNGKILQVVNGAWELVEFGGSALPSAEEVSF